MSSSSAAASKVTKRKTCDSCKLRRIRCGGALPPNNKCLNCSVHLLDCTYDSKDTKKRRREKGYIEELQDRIKELEGALRKACPDEALLQEIYSRLEDEPTQSDSDSPPAPAPPPKLSKETNQKDLSALIRSLTRLNVGSEDDPFRYDSNEAELSKRFENVKGEDTRFHGHAGYKSLIQIARTTKKGIVGQKQQMQIAACRRKMFWERHAWQFRISDIHVPPAQYTFPPQDLLYELVEAYFDNVNLLMPLLHRPTFMRSLNDNLHLRNDDFGGVLLLVCAVGSRYLRVIDERVLLDHPDPQFSSGYKWFNQVHVVKFKLLSLNNCYDLQMYALACQFLQGTSIPHNAWMLAGIGIRIAQDMGIHQSRVPIERLTVEHEHCKRAFWILVFLDRMTSINLGRACMIDKRDLDLDLPVECDDEYWEHEDPRKRFRQPPGKPTHMSAFNHLLRLNRIIAYVMQSVYHVKSKKYDYIHKGWRRVVVEEMDSALNKWLMDIPESVKYDPDRTDPKFYKVSLMLMGWFYYVQILIHRPFILSQEKDHPLPSFSICTNAARACSNLADAYRKRGYPIPLQLGLFAYISGIVLSLSLRKDGGGVDDIVKCMEFLKAAEERWFNPGKGVDTLNLILQAQGHGIQVASDDHGTYDQSQPGRMHKESFESYSEPFSGTSISAIPSTSQPRPAYSGSTECCAYALPSTSSHSRSASHPRTAYSGFTECGEYALPSTSSHSRSASHARSASYSAVPAATYPVPEFSQSRPASYHSASSIYTVPLSQSRPRSYDSEASMESLYYVPPSTVQGGYPQEAAMGYGGSAHTYDTALIPGDVGVGSYIPPPPAQVQPLEMDWNTMNMWMNAPSGIGSEDWLTFLGEYKWD